MAKPKIKPAYVIEWLPIADMPADGEEYLVCDADDYVGIGARWVDNDADPPAERTISYTVTHDVMGELVGYAVKPKAMGKG